MMMVQYGGCITISIMFIHCTREHLFQKAGLTRKLEFKGNLEDSQGGRSWLAFGERKIIPQRFRRARICKFSRQKHRFLQLRKYW